MINRWKKYRLAALAEAAAASVLVTGFCAGLSVDAQAADNNLDYRSKVVGVTGIMDNVSTGRQTLVTRGEFAQMLVNASVYRDYLPESSNVAVYADVPASNIYAPSVRIAAEQGWMTGYLGGSFKPEQPVTMQEAVRGTVEHIYYSSADVMTPTSIILDNGQEYQLDSSEMQFAFSIYGSLRVGDTVTLICEKKGNSNEEAAYTVVDYVED